jgi:hypothetical protein
MLLLLGAITLDFEEFLNWCQVNHESNKACIARRLNVSSQTIRNWNNLKNIPKWVEYATISLTNNLDPMPLNIYHLKQWQADNGLKTYQDTADAFLLKRQSVHQWYHRGSLPKWLSLACPGYSQKFKF